MIIHSIFNKATELQGKHRTTDPFELLDGLRVVVGLTDAYPINGLKGYCASFNRTNYVKINAHLCEEEQRIVAAHEAGHIVLHYRELKYSAFRDNDLYATSVQERKANLFAANFMIRDEEILELIGEFDGDFGAIARSLYVPKQFLAFKLHSMQKMGHKVRVPIELDSLFLGK